MVLGTGVVTVNGKLVPGSLTVYAGDKLVTDSNSSATITNRYGTAILAGASSIVYGGNKIQMVYGRVLITSQRGTQAVLGNLTITPAKVNQSAKFQLRQNDNTMVLTVLYGSVEVTDGANRVILVQGQMMTRETEKPKPATVLANAPEPSAPVDAATPPPVAAAHAHIPGWVIGTVAAGAAGGIVGGMAAAGMFRPASPVVP